eukprot:ANDGO_01529.mRNA.1 hypothetical protein
MGCWQSKNTREVERRNVEEHKETRGTGDAEESNQCCGARGGDDGGGCGEMQSVGFRRIPPSQSDPALFPSAVRQPTMSSFFRIAQNHHGERTSASKTENSKTQKKQDEKKKKKNKKKKLIPSPCDVDICRVSSSVSVPCFLASSTTVSDHDDPRDGGRRRNDQDGGGEGGEEEIEETYWVHGKDDGGRGVERQVMAEQSTFWRRRGLEGPESGREQRIQGAEQGGWLVVRSEDPNSLPVRVDVFDASGKWYSAVLTGVMHTTIDVSDALFVTYVCGAHSVVETLWPAHWSAFDRRAATLVPHQHQLQRRVQRGEGEQQQREEQEKVGEADWVPMRTCTVAWSTQPTAHVSRLTPSPQLAPLHQQQPGRSHLVVHRSYVCRTSRQLVAKRMVRSERHADLQWSVIDDDSELGVYIPNRFSLAAIQHADPVAAVIPELYPPPMLEQLQVPPPSQHASQHASHHVEKDEEDESQVTLELLECSPHLNSRPMNNAASL